MVSSKLRSTVDPFITRIVAPIAKVNPSLITLFGFTFSIIAGLMYASGNLIFAFITLALGSVLDVADGAVARLTNRVSAFGGFLDSLTDRYSDAVILTGIAVYLQGHYLLVITALVGSLLVSYTRARSEMEINGKCNVGYGERAERLIIIMAATLVEAASPGLNAIYWAVVLLAVLTHFTVAQRIWYTYKALEK
ncbi:MAG TPA: CDP-alcohol phosphatidyltransferase family protein [Euryarchaeota archaeon]|nr:CDP-alcohol phosphatidyltransferase family protein [Euryarchaeota archaeon]